MVKVSALLLVSASLTFLGADPVDIEEEQKNFIKTADADCKLFKAKYWYLHTSDLFRNLRGNHAKAIINFLGESTEADSTKGLKWKDSQLAKTIFTQTRSEDIESIHTEGVCAYFGLGIKLNPEVFAYAGKTCASELIELAKAWDFVLKALPAGLIQNHPERTGKLAEKFFQINKDTLRVVLSDGDVCQYLKAADVTQITDGDTLNMISPKCFSNLKHLSRTDFENISKFPKNILTELNGQPLTKVTLKALTSDQLQNLESSPEACSALELHEVSDNSARGIRGSCMEAYLAATSSSASRRFGERWKKVDKNILDVTLKTNPKLIRNIHYADYEFMPLEILNAIFATSEACEYIHQSARLKASSSAKINKDCFGNLHPKLQPGILAELKGSAPDDILAKVDSSMMSKWEHQGGGQFLKGFQVLRLIGSNVKRIVENMSIDASSHACASIPSSGVFLAEKNFVPHVTKPCVRSLNFRLRPSECQQYPQLWLMQNEKDLKKGDVAGLEQLVPHLSEEDLATLVKSKSFCKNMSWDFYKLLKNGARKAINKDCFPQLSFKSQLKEKDLANHPDDVLAKIDSATFDGLSWDEIPNAKLAHLSSDTSSGHSSAFEKLGRESFSTWNGGKVGAIGKKQWKNIASKVFQGLTCSHITGVGSEAVKYWRYSQVLEMHKEAILAFSSSQLESLGMDEDPSAIDAVTMYEEELSAGQKLAIKNRASSWSFGWRLYLIIFLILIVLAGAGVAVYFFIIKKRGPFLKLFSP